MSFLRGRGHTRETRLLMCIIMERNDTRNGVKGLVGLWVLSSQNCTYTTLQNIFI